MERVTKPSKPPTLDCGEFATEKVPSTHTVPHNETPVDDGQGSAKDMELYLKLHIANHRPG